MKLKLKPPGTKRLKLKCDILLSSFASKFILRRYNKVASAKEMTYVTNLVGIKPRDGLWRKCYDQSSDPVGTAQVRWCKCKLTQGPGLG
jgi:hypothetical protein